MRYSLSQKCAYPEEFDYVALPDDLVEVSNEDHVCILNRAAGEDFVIHEDGAVTIVALPVKDVGQLFLEAAESVRLALQNAIDTKSKEFGFSGGNALIQYAGFENAFKPLAQQFGAWEAQVWVEASAYKAQVQSGDKPMVSGSEAVLMMPEYPTDE